MANVQERKSLPSNSLSLSTMAATLSFPSANPTLRPKHRRSLATPFRCYADNSTNDNKKKNKLKHEPDSDNPLLKAAWYGSELLGIAASIFRTPSRIDEASGGAELAVDDSGSVDRTVVVESVKRDFQRSYFVTGNLTVDAYKEDCEFADPAGSFKGVRRFKRNCTNFGSLLDKSDMKLIKWEDFEDKGIGHWRFSCVLSFPWKPILSATGYTEYYFDEPSGKINRHVEHWNVPKMALFKQMLRPGKNRAIGP